MGECEPPYCAELATMSNPEVDPLRDQSRFTVGMNGKTHRRGVEHPSFSTGSSYTASSVLETTENT